ncbi:hypothetical protein B9Q04_02700 [Candidatus Marsarchaeota G2 archaeon BE_D]|jgi:hypothetical protein|uniref:Uncharacterized protein n=4 Tax=Candidatus Marsarchaeota group 2 TaxID=2203771 RepID=A0A2R6CDW1_9ARCH|nr:MAG: hypothetical protein B9Q06_04735 [Candidatus Marsarchaeota G2 archaeon ECH_B_2]PSO00337.1 MAG: hypothetical protein B9Q07_04300 [Candidatus Marsarchaeota G2 archaeon ECH_B_3]PSO02396.1 MAG: hypothetical protein B9Q05_05020 [Candidatus Marsarchaeota G2 archaeon ECH_B_1]PSO08990.1 MAG: hypothetical protein B9Q04_02700 [Candidatus Marsarchaeota G2 archaeon BE_D]
MTLVAWMVTIRFLNLEKYKQSSFGSYVAKYVNKEMRVSRFLVVLMMIGAWFFATIWALIPIGALLILYAWSRGKLS